MKLFDTYFSFYILSWIFIKLTRIYSIEIEYLNHYLTDIFAVPAMTHLGSYIISKVKYNNQLYTYPTSYLVITAFVLSFLLEYLMPKFSSNYTADILDIVCYFIGIIFYLKIHKPYSIQKYSTSEFTPS
ncbi:hypothetical protein HX096_11410 [Empedobacter falsenii]|uniref:hypothetical protein n=1 Tax=Empedobacter falsenii TaxID=343874 RepID=UPI00257770C4|nr:hypothetical protein [Empedobacter falsenii]MDM1548459.1 hypothetical protein [Empedobacter falsenii]